MKKSIIEDIKVLAKELNKVRHDNNSEGSPIFRAIFNILECGENLTTDQIFNMIIKEADGCQK